MFETLRVHIKHSSIDCPEDGVEGKKQSTRGRDSEDQLSVRETLELLQKQHSGNSLLKNRDGAHMDFSECLNILNLDR